MKIIILVDNARALGNDIVASFSVPDEYEPSPDIIANARLNGYAIRITYPTEIINPEDDISRLIGD